jgi:predicted MFS family arabinose efflux permease
MSEPAGEPSSRLRPPPITRGEWALILVLVAIHFTHMVDFVIIMPLGKRLMTELAIGPAEFGLIVASYAIAAGVASLLASLVMDRFDRRAVLLAMYAGFGLSTLYCGLAPTYAHLLAARTLAGVFGGLAAVSIMAVIGDVFPPEKRGRATGAITSSFAVASIVGLPVGLRLADAYGRGAPFVVLAAMSAVVWAVAAVRLPPVRGHLAYDRRPAVAEFVAVVREPTHLRAFAFSFFMVLGTFTIGSFVAPYFSAVNGWTEADLADVYLAAGVCTLIGMNAVGQVADRVPRLPLFRVLGFGALVTGLVVTNLPPTSLWVAAAAMTAFMVFASGRMVPAQAMMLGAAEPRARGAFMSLNTAVMHLGTGVAPLVAGALVTQSEDGRTMTGFPLVGLVAAAAAAVSLVLAGWVRPAAVPAPEPVTPPEAEIEAATA